MCWNIVLQKDFNCIRTKLYCGQCSQSNIFPDLRSVMVSKFREIKIPKEPLTMPVTVLVFRETLSLEHLIKLMIHFINFEFYNKCHLSKHSAQVGDNSCSVSFKHLSFPIKQSWSWWKCWKRNTMLMTDMVRKLNTLSRSKIFIARSFVFVIDLFFIKFRPEIAYLNTTEDKHTPKSLLNFSWPDLKTLELNNHLPITRATRGASAHQ